jgi:hypothetical protein
MNYVIDLFKDLINKNDLNDEAIFLHSVTYPAFLSTRTLKNLDGYIRTLSPQRKEIAGDVVATFQHLIEEISKDLSLYPFGAGPIKEIYEQFKGGGISLEHACRLAKDPRVYSLLSPLYVYAITIQLEDILQTDHLSWQKGVNFLKILFAALEAVPKKLQGEIDYFNMWSSTVIAWLMVVSAATREVPDGRLFNSAVNYGEALAAKRTEFPNSSYPALALHRLGTLHFDPYFAGRSTESITNLSLQLQKWRQRLDDFFGSSLAGVQEEELSIPSPEEAIKKAVLYLEEAASFRQGVEKARTLKALVQAYDIKYLYYEGGVTDEIKLYGNEALRLLHPVNDFIGERTEIAKIMQKYNVISENEYQEWENPDFTLLLNRSPKAILEQTGKIKTFDLFGQAIQHFLEAGPKIAYTLWIRSNELIEAYDPEQQQMHYRIGLDVISKTIADQRIYQFRKSKTIEAVNAIAKIAQNEKWPIEKISASRIAIAIWSSSRDEEEQGLEILERELLSVAGLEKLNVFNEVLQFHKSVLHIGAAVNAWNRKDLIPAIEHYFHALEIVLSQNQRIQVSDLLKRIKDLAIKADEEAVIRILVHTTIHAFRIEIVAGVQGRGRCQDIYRILMQRYYHLKMSNAVVLFRLLEYAKGFNFGATLDRDYRLRVQDEPEAINLLQSIEQLSQKIIHVQAASKEDVQPGGIDEEDLLAAYVGEGENLAGENDEEILDNLKVQFDVLLHHRLLQEADNSKDYFISPESIQNSIGSNTVLLCQYLGAAPSSDAAIYSLLVTKEEIRFIFGYTPGLPSAEVRMRDKHRVINVPVLGMTIRETRKNIQEDPGNGDISSEGLRSLRADVNLFFGDVDKMLRNFKAKGKNHLCIVPHGPLHHYPYHLLPVGSGILADEWIVSYLPNLKLLDPSLRKFGPTDKMIDDSGNMRFGNITLQIRDDRFISEVKAKEKKRRPITSLGISFSGDTPPHQLGELENATLEAIKVAQVFDEEALTDHKATEAAFWEAVMNSKSVHIATHGQHHVTAPAFHCFYLCPTPGTDGIIYNYELFGADLRGLDLITLSACETALGRFDIADNIRGLPAALLLAGVSTIIGTLWEAETYSCELFFVTLYQELKNGKSKLEAFYTAQKTTRAAFPQYRDWGAFYMIGNY